MSPTHLTVNSIERLIKNQSLRRASLFVVIAALGCSAEDDPGGGGTGGTTSGGNSTSGATSSAGTGGMNTAGMNTAGVDTGGMNAGSMETGGSAGAENPADAHCGPASVNEGIEFVVCDDYDPFLNGIPSDPTYLSTFHMSLETPLTPGEPLAISRNMLAGMGVTEFWGSDTECGPAQQLLATVTEAGVACADSTPNAAYIHIIQVVRSDPTTDLFDSRFCRGAMCPE